MLMQLLAAASVSPGTPEETRLLRDIYHMVVEQLPPGGLRLVLVLAGLAVAVGVWIAWGQRTLANNQMKIAAMLQAHLDEHHGKK